MSNAKIFALFSIFWAIFGVTPMQRRPPVEAVVSWDVEFFTSGVSDAGNRMMVPIAPTQTILRSDATCNQTFVAGVDPIVDPTQLYIPDPSNAGKYCIATLNLTSVPPISTIVLTVAARGATTTSPRSAPSNVFEHTAPAAPPTAPAAPRVK